MTSPTFIDWTRDAWAHWHRPWALMHESWQTLGHGALIEAGATEYWLRLHYADWCARYDLSSVPVAALVTGVDVRDPGWRLLALSRDEFDLCMRLTGWTLRFAAVPADRLKRGAALALDEMRWCLARAPLIPLTLARSVAGAGGELPCESAMATVALHGWLRTASPTLWPRLRLRCARDAALAAEHSFEHGDGVNGAAEPGNPKNSVGELGARLWRAALRQAAGPAAFARSLTPRSAQDSSIEELAT